MALKIVRDQERSPLESKMPCPVCLGVTMTKVTLGAGGKNALTLDHCGRCGGIWFDGGDLEAGVGRIAGPAALDLRAVGARRRRCGSSRRARLEPVARVRSRGPHRACRGRGTQRARTRA